MCLRSKIYSFDCGDDSKNKFKGVYKSQRKHMKFTEYKNCLDGENYQKDSDNYLIRSLNHEMYLQQVKNLHSLYLMTNDVI